MGSPLREQLVKGYVILPVIASTCFGGLGCITRKRQGIVGQALDKVAN